MGKAAVTRGTSEDHGEWRCHSEYRGRIRQSQEAVPAMTLKDVEGCNSCMEMGTDVEKKASYQQIWSLSVSLSMV